MLTFRISILFPFFRGDYVGWKDSIRHNLSSCHSFIKCSSLNTDSNADGNGGKAKIGGSWTFHHGGLDADRLLRQNTSVARSAMESGTRYVKDLRLRIEFRNGNLTFAAAKNISKVRKNLWFLTLYFHLVIPISSIHIFQPSKLKPLPKQISVVLNINRYLRLISTRVLNRFSLNVSETN